MFCSYFSLFNSKREDFPRGTVLGMQVRFLARQLKSRHLLDKKKIKTENRNSSVTNSLGTLKMVPIKKSLKILILKEKYVYILLLSFIIYQRIINFLSFLSYLLFPPYFSFLLLFFLSLFIPIGF